MLNTLWKHSSTHLGRQRGNDQRCCSIQVGCGMLPSAGSLGTTATGPPLAQGLQRNALVLVAWQLIPVLSVLTGTAAAGSAHTYALKGGPLQNKASLVARTMQATGLSEAMMKEWGDTLGQHAASATMVSKCVAPGGTQRPAY